MKCSQCRTKLGPDDHGFKCQRPDGKIVTVCKACYGYWHMVKSCYGNGKHGKAQH